MKDLEAIPDRTTDPAEWRECPFDGRLARTPYLVIPKLAIQAMPMDWRDRLEALLCEADAAGMETPEYYVFRQDPSLTVATRSDSEDDYSPVREVYAMHEDPWADYRRGDIHELCPAFVVPEEPSPLLTAEEGPGCKPSVGHTDNV